VRLGAERSALQAYRHIWRAFLVRLHRGIGRDRFGRLGPLGVVAPPPLDAHGFRGRTAARARGRARRRVGSACRDHPYRGQGLQETPTILHYVPYLMKIPPAGYHLTIMGLITAVI